MFFSFLYSRRYLLVTIHPFWPTRRFPPRATPRAPPVVTRNAPDPPTDKPSVDARPKHRSGFRNLFLCSICKPNPYFEISRFKWREISRTADAEISHSMKFVGFCSLLHLGGWFRVGDFVTRNALYNGFQSTFAGMCRNSKKYIVECVANCLAKGINASDKPRLGLRRTIAS